MLPTIIGAPRINNDCIHGERVNDEAKAMASKLAFYF